MVPTQGTEVDFLGAMGTGPSIQQNDGGGGGKPWKSFSQEVSRYCKNPEMLLFFSSHLSPLPQHGGPLSIAIGLYSEGYGAEKAP